MKHDYQDGIAYMRGRVEEERVKRLREEEEAREKFSADFARFCGHLAPIGRLR